VHCRTNAGGNTHAITGGLTANAPQSAFETFHFGVHIGVLVEGPNPHVLAPNFTGTCYRVDRERALERSTGFCSGRFAGARGGSAACRRMREPAQPNRAPAHARTSSIPVV
jgi:hypothetical protein